MLGTPRLIYVVRPLEELIIFYSPISAIYPISGELSNIGKRKNLTSINPKMESKETIFILNSIISYDSYDLIVLQAKKAPTAIAEKEYQVVPITLDKNIS